MTIQNTLWALRSKPVFLEMGENLVLIPLPEERLRMAGRAVKESPPGHLVKDCVLRMCQSVF